MPPHMGQGHGMDAPTGHGHLASMQEALQVQAQGQGMLAAQNSGYLGPGGGGRMVSPYRLPEDDPSLGMVALGHGHGHGPRVHSHGHPMGMMMPMGGGARGMRQQGGIADQMGGLALSRDGAGLPGMDMMMRSGPDGQGAANDSSRGDGSNWGGSGRPLTGGGGASGGGGGRFMGASQPLPPGHAMERQQRPAPQPPPPLSYGSTPQVAVTTHGGATYFYAPGQGAGGMVPSQGGGGRAGGLRPGVKGPFPGAPGGGVGGLHPHASFLVPGSAPLESRFMTEALRQQLQHRAALRLARVDPESDVTDLPDMIREYHSLMPLEETPGEGDPPSASFGVRSYLVKGISSINGSAYVLRRIDGRQVIPTAELAAAAADAVARWQVLVGHPHLCVPADSFVSDELDESAALFFTSQYYPGAVTLESAHLSLEQPSGGLLHLTVSEEHLWSYAVQLASAMQAAHGAGLALRLGCIHPSKVLLVGKNRLRVGSLGVLDVLHDDAGDNLHALQANDLVGLGRLLLSLACASYSNANLEFVAAHYSPALHSLIALLLLGPEESGGVHRMQQLSQLLAQHALNEAEHAHLYADALLAELDKEVENGRLLRLLVRLGAINERPDGDVDQGWAETGDRYLLKLFRDFVFHQVDENGAPRVDWGHIIEALGKLDVGSPEKVLLMSRDERSMIVASYRNLKKCVDNAYSELLAVGARA